MLKQQFFSEEKQSDWKKLASLLCLKNGKVSQSFTNVESKKIVDSD